MLLEKRFGLRLLETENFTVGQDWEVPILGFLILATKNTKYKRVTEFDKGMQHEFIELLVKIRKLMEIVLKIEDVYFFQNEDTEHGFHVWIFPRHSWMERFGRKIESVRPIMNFAKENMWTEENIADVKKDIEKLRNAL
jgi:diadenosine tetraphosphate (Ap4A) HIT family hydrolase